MLMGEVKMRKKWDALLLQHRSCCTLVQNDVCVRDNLC